LEDTSKERKVVPRQARLDAPGILHHVIIRGIKQRQIVDDDEDRKKQFYGAENREIAIQYIKRECQDRGVDIKALKAGSRRRKISKIRVRLIEKLVEEFGFSLAETGRQLGVSSSAVAKALSRRKDKES
jgi:hypothetical protein